MMAEFKASDGTIIRWGEDSQIEWEWGGASKQEDRRIPYMVSSPIDGAMAEWYRHRRDEELGRWRDPEYPDFVVYRDPRYDGRDGRFIRVVNESTGQTYNFGEHFSSLGLGEWAAFEGVARDWFAAHPVEEPWHAAEPGEAWEITLDGVQEAAIVSWTLPDDKRFCMAGGSHVELTDPGITGGRRIWPEDGDKETQE